MGSLKKTELAAGLGLIFICALVSTRHYLIPLGEARINLATIIGLPGWLATFLLIERVYFQGLAKKEHLLLLSSVSLLYTVLIFAYTHSALLAAGTVIFLISGMAFISLQYYVLDTIQKMKDGVQWQRSWF